MSKDKVFIVCATLDTLGNTLLLRKIKPNRKTQEIKVGWERMTKGKYINEKGNHLTIKNKLWQPKEDTKETERSLNPSVFHKTLTAKTYTD